VVKEVPGEDLARAIDLVNNVFSEFVAPGYSEQGRNTFESYLKGKLQEVSADLKTGHKKMWAYYREGEIIGVIATQGTSHISLMFVDKRYHRKGIARQMFCAVLEDIKRNEKLVQVTVNSSPYAVKAYEHLGFAKTDDEQEKDGIIFVPMSRSL